jgi:peptidyl-tRNA hydrolase, PTH2 family
VKLVLVVRTDLGMGRGKLAAQVAHAAVAAALSSGTPARDAWLADGQPKVVLRADDEEHLARLVAAATAAGLPVEVVRDAGRTQVPAGTVTCAAVGPAPDDAVDAVTGDLRLL